MDAEAALEAIVAGDMDALEWLYRELRVPVFAVALAVTADRGLAEDATARRSCSSASGGSPRPSTNGG